MSYRTLRYRPASLGDLGEVDIGIIFKRMGASMKQQAMARAALQLTVSLVLNAIPILGQALSAVYGVVSSLVGSRYERAIQEEVASFKQEMSEYVNKAQLRYVDAQSDLVNRVAPDAIALAVSGAPLSGMWEDVQRMNPGMGDIWSRAKNTVIGRAAQVTTIVKRVVPKPVVRTATSAISRVDSDLAHQVMNPLKTGRAIVTLATSTVTPMLAPAANLIPGQALYALTPLGPVLLLAQAASIAGKVLPDSKVADLLKKPQEVIGKTSRQIDRGIDMASGRSGLDDVRAAISKARALAFGDIDNQVRDQIAQLNSPAFIKQTIIQLATLIRESPGFSYISQGLPPPPGSMGPLPVSKSPAIFGAAAVAALLFLSH